jgi:hypothetical protein
VIDYLQPIEPASAVCDLCERLSEQIPASEYSLCLDLLTFRETCTPWHGRQLADALCVAERHDLAEQVEALLPADVPSGMMFFIDPPFVVSHPAAQDLMARLMQEWDEREAQNAKRAAPALRQRAGWLRAVWGSAGAPARPRPSRAFLLKAG